MSRLAALALEREMLLQRSARCRLQLARDAMGLRAAVRWPRAGGVTRVARFVAIGGRILFFLRIARVAAGFLRSR